MKSVPAETIARIEKMEQHFDLLCDRVKAGPDFLEKDESLRAVFDELIHYYTGGRWLRDYELDEKGLQPKPPSAGLFVSKSSSGAITSVIK